MFGRRPPGLQIQKRGAGFRLQLTWPGWRHEHGFYGVVMLTPYVWSARCLPSAGGPGTDSARPRSFPVSWHTETEPSFSPVGFQA